jgi:hypothetical protein
MGGGPQGAMRVASQIWQVVFPSQTLQVFCLALCKKAQYVVVMCSPLLFHMHRNILLMVCSNLEFERVDFSCSNAFHPPLVQVHLLEGIMSKYMFWPQTCV